jgi:SAM-dependent methyltransferase
MNSLRRKTLDRLRTFGINLNQLLRGLRRWPVFKRELAEFQRQQAASSVPFAEGPLYPCLYDNTAASGSTTGHYFSQDLLVARKVFRNHPRRHLDVGSRVDGFIAHVAAFREIEILDIRPLKSTIVNVKFQCADLSAPLPPELIACCDSLSCLHTIEHFGLGRYGDPIMYTGYLDGLKNLHQILAPGGKFYFSTPMGPQRVEFNAHRVFSARYLWELLSPLYRIDTFSYVTEEGELHEDIDLAAPGRQEEIDRSFGCRYGCAIFELTKL